MLSSPKGWPISCRPMGRPPLLMPAGTEMAQVPARFTGMVKMSERYICSGSAVFSPILKAGVGATGVSEQVNLGKRREKILHDQGAHLLGLEVIGVVVARGERIGAEHDAPLHLGAEPFARASSCTSPAVRRHRCPVAVPHPVIAGQIGAGLGRGQQVVGGNRVVGVGQGHFHKLRAQSSAGAIAASMACLTSASRPSIKYSWGRPIFSPLQLRRRPPCSRAPGSRHWWNRADRGRQWRRAGWRHRSRPGHRPDLVEGGGVGDNAVA